MSLPMQTFYVASALGLMLVWLALAVIGPRKVDVPSTLTRLRYGALIRSLALVLALALPMITVYVVAKFLWSTPTKLNLAGISLLSLSMIAGLPLIEVSRVQIVVSEDGLTKLSPWLGLNTIKWTEVVRV